MAERPKVSKYYEANKNARNNIRRQLAMAGKVSAYDSKFGDSYNRELTFLLPRIALKIDWLPGGDPNLPVAERGGRNSKIEDLPSIIGDPLLVFIGDAQMMAEYQARLDSIANNVYGVLINGGVLYSERNPKKPKIANRDQSCLRRLIELEDVYQIDALMRNLTGRTDKGVVFKLEASDSRFEATGIKLNPKGERFASVIPRNTHQSLFRDKHGRYFLRNSDTFYSGSYALSELRDLIVTELTESVFGVRGLPVRRLEQVSGNTLLVEDYVYLDTAKHLMNAMLSDLVTAVPQPKGLHRWWVNQTLVPVHGFSPLRKYSAESSTFPYRD